MTAAKHAIWFCGALVLTRLCHSGILWVEECYPIAAALQMFRGKLLYRDVWFDKPPLFAAFYAMIGAPIGWPLRLAGAGFVTLCCLLVFRFARELWGEREGLAAAGLLGFFLTFDTPSAVVALAPDLLMMAPHTLAVYLAWKRRPLLAGLAAGAALLVNPKGVFVLAACLLWTGRGWPWLLAGFAAPNAFACAWLGRPYLDEVWKWGWLYSQSVFAFSTGAVRTLDWSGFHAALIVGVAVYFWKERPYRMLAWLALSFAAVAAGWRFFPRYYFALLPVMTLAAARGYVLLGRWRAIVGVLLLVPLIRFGPRYVLLVNDLLSSQRPAWADVQMNEDSSDAAELIGHKGTLLVWGYRPDIFAYTRMQAGSRFLDSQPLTGVLADRHLTNSDVAAPELAAANRRELTTTRPSFIADGLAPFNPSLAITQYADLRAWLSNYREVGRTRFTVIYERVSP